MYYKVPAFFEMGNTDLDGIRMGYGKDCRVFLREWL